MRIALPFQVEQDFAEQLSATLELTLFMPETILDSRTGLLSDDQIIAQIIKFIVDATKGTAGDKGILLKGYPLNIIQAQSLDTALSRIGQPLSAAIMSNSLSQSQNRENRALIRYYRSQNKLTLFDEEANIDDISSKILLIQKKRRTPTVVK